MWSNDIHLHVIPGYLSFWWNNICQLLISIWTKNHVCFPTASLNWIFHIWLTIIATAWYVPFYAETLRHVDEDKKPSACWCLFREAKETHCHGDRTDEGQMKQQQRGRDSNHDIQKGDCFTLTFMSMNVLFIICISLEALAKTEWTLIWLVFSLFYFIFNWSGCSFVFQTDFHWWPCTLLPVTPAT